MINEQFYSKQTFNFSPLPNRYEPGLRPQTQPVLPDVFTTYANTVVSDIRATAGPLLSLAAVWFGRRAAAAIVLVSFHDAQTFICVEATGSQSDERGLAAVRSGRIKSAGGFLLLLLEVVVVFSRLCFHENTL